MKIWKWFGWDTKEARIVKNQNNNYHATIQTLVMFVGLVVITYIIWG